MIIASTRYMKTRCPAWCDRILLSKKAETKVLCKEGKFHSDDDGGGDIVNSPQCNGGKCGNEIEYNVMGSDVCMGDHKPVYLSFRIRHGADEKLEESCYTHKNLTRTHNNREKFPRVESPTYVDLLTNTDFDVLPIPAKKTIEDDTCLSDKLPASLILSTSSEPQNTTEKETGCCCFRKLFKETTV